MLYTFDHIIYKLLNGIRRGITKYKQIYTINNVLEAHVQVYR